MQGMIAHHAQAIVMARMAPTHGARPTVSTLASRIDLAQTTEIRLMQDWLRVRGFPVPDSTGRMPADPNDPHAGHDMTHSDSVGMDGMLTPYQMGLLAEARGASFDRLFLTFMIQHHAGAVRMVEKLFNSPAGGQDDDIFKFASGVQADQTSEIDRMKEMLAALRTGGGGG
jgi:uncharacterized protein (DUF305 family)